MATKYRRKRMWAVRNPYNRILVIAPDSTHSWWYAAEETGYFGRCNYIDVMKRDGFKLTAIYIRVREKRI